MMDALFAQYERELVTLRSLCREYAQRYPKVAAQLQLDSDVCEDPHVERLIQSVALLCARVARRVDHAQTQFTEALLNQLLPHYLRPFPSCAIAHFPTACSEVIPRGTRLETAPVQGVACIFQTAYAVAPAAVILTAARFEPVIQAPPGTPLPPDASALLTIAGRIALPAERVRIYLDADPSLSAALREALLGRMARAYVQAADGGPWHALPANPITPAGFDDDDALIPYPAASHEAYRILTEYFAFPEKFNFVDLDLNAVRRALPAGVRQWHLRLVLTGIDAEAEASSLLAKFGVQHLALGCTPVVNLFRRPGVPFAHTGHSAEYTVLADAAHPHAFDIYAVEQVRLIRHHTKAISVTEFRPFFALCHGEAEAGNYWIVRRDEALAAASPGHETSISLVNADGDPQPVEKPVVSLELSCTNRDLPVSVRVGAPEGDLFLAGAAQSAPIRFVRRPTRPLRLRHAGQAHWRLISHLSCNVQALFEHGARGLRELLTLYDLAQSPSTRRQIQGIVDASRADATAWIHAKDGTCLMHGIEVRLTVDEVAFVGSGLHLFAQMLDRFFASYVYVNSFAELVLISHHTGTELYRCPPRRGSRSLL